MGCKIDSYVDDNGVTVKDGDTVIYRGKEYTVSYISHAYVNLIGSGGLHVHFGAVKPNKKVTPTQFKDLSDVDKGALLLAEYLHKPVEVFYDGLWNSKYQGYPFDDSRVYRIKPTPVRKTVELYGTEKLKGFGIMSSAKTSYIITFDTIDDVPVMDSIQMNRI